MNEHYVAPVASAHQIKNDALLESRMLINELYVNYYEFLPPDKKEEINKTLFKINEALEA